MAQNHTQNAFQGLEETKIFKNLDPLDTDITPDKNEFIGREEEKKKIVNCLKYLAEGYSGENFLVTGNTGYGKTACVRILLKDLENYVGNELQSVYIRDSTSENNVLCMISEKLDLGTRAKRNRTHYNKIKEYLIENDQKLVLVLDELDKLFDENRRKDHGNELLKNLLEIRKDVVDESDGTLVLAGITNEIDVEKKFNSKVNSRINETTIQFSSYDAGQLRKILEVRAEKAFRQGVLEDGVISKCSAKIAQEDGDARKAIRLLKKSAKMANEKEMPKISKRLVDKAKREIERNKTKDAVKGLPKQEKLVLLSLLKKRQKTTVTGDLYSKYETICKRVTMTTVSQRRFQELIQDLDMLGLLNATVKNLSGQRGRTREISHDYSSEMEEEIQDLIVEIIQELDTDSV